MRDPAGPGLSPDPFGLHPEPVGEFVSGQQPVHLGPLLVGGDAGDRVSDDDPHGDVVGARLPFGPAAGAR